MRVDYRRVLPELYQGMHQVQGLIDQAPVDRRLLELVKLRASQINGCAFCVEMHSRDALRFGENEERLRLVAAWRGAACFTPGERAALEWCERVTNIAGEDRTAGAFEALRQHFNEAEVVALTWAIAVINAWNRISIPMGREGGVGLERGQANG